MQNEDDEQRWNDTLLRTIMHSKGDNKPSHNTTIILFEMQRYNCGNYIPDTKMTNHALCGAQPQQS